MHEGEVIWLVTLAQQSLRRNFGNHMCEKRSLELEEKLHIVVSRGKHGLATTAAGRLAYIEKFCGFPLLLQIYKVYLASVLR